MSRAASGPGSADAMEVAQAIAAIRARRSDERPTSGGEAETGSEDALPAHAGAIAVEIERIRGLRQRRERRISIATDVAALRDVVDRTHRSIGELGAIWAEVLPPMLVAHTALTSLRGGVLCVTADSSAVAYEIDCHLRAGALARLRGRYRRTLARVRVRVGRLP